MADWTMKSTPTISGDDDEWGDFIAPPQSNQIPPQSNGFHSIPASKQANPLGISENHRQKGPLPLSIFGEMEEEVDGKGFDHVGGSLVIEGLRKRVDLGVGFGDRGLRDSDQEMDGGVGSSFGFDGSGLDLRVDRGLGERGEVIDDDRGDDDDDGWEFKGAFDVRDGGAGTGAVLPEVMTSGVKQGTSLVVENKPAFSHSSNGFDNWFSASGAGFDKSSGSNHGWNFEWIAIAHNGSTALPVSGAKDIGKENGTSSNSMGDNDEFDEFGDFIVANSAVGTTHQESPNTSHTKSTESHLSNGKEEQTAAPKDTSDQNLLDWKAQDFPSKLENGNGALPLSVFSDRVVDYDDHHQDILIQKLPSDPKFGIGSQGSGISIHDLVSTLYSEALPNGQVAHTSSVIPGTVPDETVAQTSQNGDGFLDDDSWEFKYASSEAVVSQQPSNPEQGVAQQLSTKPSRILARVDLYEKLRNELSLLVSHQLDDLKKASNIDAGNSKDGNAGDINGVQEANKVLKDGVLSHEVQPGEKLPRESHLHEILELLRVPEFQVLESEYLLSEKLQLAQKDRKSAVDLLQHIQMVLKVLTLASEEEQSAYLSTWARIVAVCAEELAHGSLIWKQAFENNVHGQLMSDTRGQRHIQALGGIYRVVQLLGSSAKLYKPWILLNSANVIDLIPLLDECTTLWSDSGLEERLENLSDVGETKNCILIQGLLESIKHIRNIDVLSMLDLDFTAPASFCQMTLLPLEILSGLEAVLWNERLYFLSVANLWANLVSSEPPQLPRLCG